MTVLMAFTIGSTALYRLCAITFTRHGKAIGIAAVSAIASSAAYRLLADMFGDGPVSVALPVMISVIAIVTCGVATGALVNSLSRFGRVYRIGPIGYQKIMVDGESTYCFQVRTNYRGEATFGKQQSVNCTSLVNVSSK